MDYGKVRLAKVRKSTDTNYLPYEAQSRSAVFFKIRKAKGFRDLWLPVESIGYYLNQASLLLVSSTSNIPGLKPFQMSRNFS